MSVFVDTSALVAAMSADEHRHQDADEAWRRLAATDEALVTTNYTLLELYAVLQRRGGMPAVRLLTTVYVPILDIHWVTRGEHDAALAAYLAADRRTLSLVDCISFDIMHKLGVLRAFTLDPHFAEHGFELVPEPLAP